MKNLAILVGAVIMALTVVVYNIKHPSAPHTYPSYYFSYVYQTPTANGFGSGSFDGRTDDLRLSDLANVKAVLLKQNTNYIDAEITFVKEIKK